MRKGSETGTRRAGLNLAPRPLARHLVFGFKHSASFFSPAVCMGRVALGLRYCGPSRKRWEKEIPKQIREPHQRPFLQGSKTVSCLQPFTTAAKSPRHSAPCNAVPVYYHGLVKNVYTHEGRNDPQAETGPGEITGFRSRWTPPESRCRIRAERGIRAGLAKLPRRPS
jgi:hypothetical protein